MRDVTTTTNKETADEREENEEGRREKDWGSSALLAGVVLPVGMGRLLQLNAGLLGGIVVLGSTVLRRRALDAALLLLRILLGRILLLLRRLRVLLLGVLLLVLRLMRLLAHAGPSRAPERLQALTTSTAGRYASTAVSTELWQGDR